MKPILFNTDMVRAILEGRKTVTRRVAFSRKDLREFPREEYPDGWWFRGRAYPTWDSAMREPQGVMSLCKYRPGDILYVRETFWKGVPGVYEYKADYEDNPGYVWTPSIHMPREAARIFLRVTDVRVERLQWCGNMEAKEEGCTCCSQFVRLWDTTIKKADRTLYGWEANPWVWVIGFERISKEEAYHASNPAP